MSCLRNDTSSSNSGNLCRSISTYFMGSASYTVRVRSPTIMYIAPAGMIGCKPSTLLNSSWQATALFSNMATVSVKNDSGTFLKISDNACWIREHGPMFLVASLCRPGLIWTEAVWGTRSGQLLTDLTLQHSLQVMNNDPAHSPTRDKVTLRESPTRQHRHFLSHWWHSMELLSLKHLKTGEVHKPLSTWCYKLNIHNQLSKWWSNKNGNCLLQPQVLALWLTMLAYVSSAIMGSLCFLAMLTKPLRWSAE